MDWKNKVPNLLLRACPLVMFMKLVGKHLRVRLCIGAGVQKLARCYLEVLYLFEGVATKQPCRQIRGTHKLQPRFLCRTLERNYVMPVSLWVHLSVDVKSTGPSKLELQGYSSWIRTSLNEDIHWYLGECKQEMLTWSFVHTGARRPNPGCKATDQRCCTMSTGT